MERLVLGIRYKDKNYFLPIVGCTNIRNQTLLSFTSCLQNHGYDSDDFVCYDRLLRFVTTYKVFKSVNFSVIQRLVRCTKRCVKVDFENECLRVCDECLRTRKRSVGCEELPKRLKMVT